MLQRLQITFAQLKADNTSENLLNEMRHVVYFLYEANQFTKKVYNNIMDT